MTEAICYVGGVKIGEAFQMKQIIQHRLLNIFIDPHMHSDVHIQRQRHLHQYTYTNMQQSTRRNTIGRGYVAKRQIELHKDRATMPKVCGI